MAQRDKLLFDILNNANDVRFDDACKVAEWLGFSWSSGKGAHRAYSRAGEMEQLNFQDRGGKIKPYQAKQLQRMIGRYWDFELGGPR